MYVENQKKKHEGTFQIYSSVDFSLFPTTGMNIFVAFFVLLLLLADSTPPAASSIPLIGRPACHAGATCRPPHLPTPAMCPLTSSCQFHISLLFLSDITSCIILVAVLSVASFPVCTFSPSPRWCQVAMGLYLFVLEHVLAHCVGFLCLCVNYPPNMDIVPACITPQHHHHHQPLADHLMVEQLHPLIKT